VSLIGEALKRARLEAARREGEARSTAYASAPAYAPRRRRPPATMVAAGLALGLVAGAGAYWALRAGGFAPEPPPVEAVRPAVSETLSAPMPAPVPTAAAASQPATPEPPPIPVAPQQLPIAPPPTPAAPALFSLPSASPTAPIEARGDRARLARQPAAPPEAGRTYSRAVDLAGGKRLELDGIVASPTEPLAMMNRRLLAPGEVIEGHTILRIEPKRVELRGPSGATFFISLR
jgi:hypothetical protein